MPIKNKIKSRKWQCGVIKTAEILKKCEIDGTALQSNTSNHNKSLTHSNTV